MPRDTACKAERHFTAHALTHMQASDTLLCLPGMNYRF